MAADPPPTLELEAVRFAYTTAGEAKTIFASRSLPRCDFLVAVSVTVRPGECWAIIGPNGAGKSTLLRLMAGLLRPHAGCIRLAGQDLLTVPGRRRARRIAFLPQQPPSDLDLSVRDIILMGRFPHRSYSLFESAEDHRLADRAMELTKTDAFADRPIATLSGGEAQRVHLAAAIAQAPDLLLLDEPTASLDIQYQLGIFEILRKRADADRLAVVVVTHDVNLAARFCSHVLLLEGGRQVATGPPALVITPEVLAPVYGVELMSLSDPADSAYGWIVPTRERRNATVQGGASARKANCGPEPPIRAYK